MPHRVYKKAAQLLLFALAFQGCATGDPGNWKNEGIPNGKREDFHLLNNEALSYLKISDIKSLQRLLSKELIEDHYTERQANLLGNRLKTVDYVLFNEYYAVNKYKDYDTIRSAGKGKYQYDLIYPGTTEETYIAFFLPKQDLNDKWLIALIYHKFNYGWKISELDLGPYTRNGKTAPELYAFAKERYNKGYLIDAVNNMQLATDCLKPTDIWCYPNDKESNNFYSQMMMEANQKYRFPYPVTGVSTQPRIFRIVNEAGPGGTYPTVYYLSKVSLKDDAGIKKENDAVKKVISKLIPGIDKDKKYVLYTVFNEMPNSMRSVERV